MGFPCRFPPYRKRLLELYGKSSNIRPGRRCVVPRQPRFAERDEISSLSRQRTPSPGRAERAVKRKKTPHPTDSTRKPEVGATKIRPSAAREERRAYWVAV